MKAVRLGEILVEEGLITRQQLQDALLLQKDKRKPLGEVLIELGYIDEETILNALSKQLNIPYVSFKGGMLKMLNGQKLDEILPYDVALRYVVFPLNLNEQDVLTCAVNDPLDVILLDNLTRITGKKINFVLSSKQDILQAIDKYYGDKGLLNAAIRNADESEEGVITIDDTGRTYSIDQLIAEAEDAPVVHLVDLLLQQAIKKGASDIHIEPQRESVMVRYRVDGKLQEVPPPPKKLHMPIVSRIKILSGLDISEKRLPQDGAMSVRVEDKIIDIRVSTVPVLYGEKVVLRLLDKTRVPLDLGRLGFEKAALEAFRKAIHSPYGLVFLTGPTGSGKTTTLYAALNEINTLDKNIMTVEDPVEYRLDHINQVTVHPEIGLTFASALRSFLRQDPDIIMVGEVRDLETAQICVRSALTGHLVLSTLHTNDSSSAITRLVDMGIEPFLLMPSLSIVVAQRLLRVLCPECKEPYEPKPEGLDKLLVERGIELAYKPKGCELCNNVGYKGRMAIHEVLAVDGDIRALMGKGASSEDIKALAIKKGMTTLLESAIGKVKSGLTSIDEAVSAVI